jgi:hypothetical protein
VIIEQKIYIKVSLEEKEDMEYLKANLAEMSAEMDTIQDKLDAHQKKTETGLKPRETEKKTMCKKQRPQIWRSI